MTTKLFGLQECPLYEGHGHISNLEEKEKNRYPMATAWARSRDSRVAQYGSFHHSNTGPMTPSRLSTPLMTSTDPLPLLLVITTPPLGALLVLWVTKWHNVFYTMAWSKAVYRLNVVSLVGHKARSMKPTNNSYTIFPFLLLEGFCRGKVIIYTGAMKLSEIKFCVHTVVKLRSTVKVYMYEVPWYSFDWTTWWDVIHVHKWNC